MNLIRHVILVIQLNVKNSNINENFLLKVNIFCTFMQDKIEEANFLNSLLEEMNDQDDYFQNIFLNLKESNKNTGKF